MYVGNDSIFESNLKDFEAIEKDENKNIDAVEEDKANERLQSFHVEFDIKVEGIESPSNVSTWISNAIQKLGYDVDNLSVGIHHPRKESKIEEQGDIGGKMIGPIEIEDGDFDVLADTLVSLSEIHPDLAEFEGEGNITLVVTDGERFIGVDPQGYDYARYKTNVFNSVEAVMDASKQEMGWHRKYAVR